MVKVNAPSSRPFNIETESEAAVVTRVADPLNQFRIQISPASLAQVAADQLPWARAYTNHTNVTGQQGGTMESTHSFMPGDMVYIERPTSSNREYMVTRGHTNTLQQGQGFGGNQSDYAYSGYHPTQDAQTAKPMRTQATYPQDGMPTWNNPGKIMFQLAQQSKDIRGYFKSKLQQYNGLSDPKQWQGDQQGGQHILNSMAKGTPIPQVILQQDKTHYAEADHTSNPVQILQRLRQEINTSSFDQQFQKSQFANVNTIQTLLQGGGGGFGQMLGMAQNLMSFFNKAGQQAVSTGVAQNSAMASGKQQTANGDVMTANAAANSINTDTNVWQV